jgi:glycosyltransferase involved in cell wall biosynthesis
MAKEIVIIMPAYNAGKTIENTFARIPPEVRSLVARYIVVDDGSTDDTRSALARLTAAFPRMTVLAHKKNRGYGAAEKTLLVKALENRSAVVVLLHADGQYSPEMIPSLIAPALKGQADLVQGSRMLGGGALKGGMPLYKYAANRGLTLLENIAFGMRMAEYHSGFMVYSRKLLETVPFQLFSDAFDFDLEMIVAARVLELPIREIAIPTIYAEEVSHLKPVRYGFAVLGVIGKFFRGRYHAMLGVPRNA